MGLGQTCYPKKIGCLGQTMIEFFQMSSLLTRYPIRQTYPNLSWLYLCETSVEPLATLRSEAHAKHLHVQRGYAVVLQMVEIQLDGFSLSLA